MKDIDYIVKYLQGKVKQGTSLAGLVGNQRGFRQIPVARGRARVRTPRVRVWWQQIPAKEP